MFDWFKKRKPESSSDRLPAPEEAAKNPVGWARTSVTTEKLVRQMKAPKDVRVSVSSAGAVEAVCKACAEQISPAAKGGLLWLVCARCQGASVHFETTLDIPASPEDAREAGLSVLREIGRADPELPALSVICGSGHLNLNPTVVSLVIAPFERGARVSVRGIAKEGLVKQDSARKAVEKVRDLLQRRYA